MKIFSYSTLAFLIASCASYSQMYQIQEIKSVSHSLPQSELDYKGSHLNIYYNFWEQDKTFSCIIENKSDSLISMDLSLSHFVLNTFAYPYYTNSSTTGTIYYSPNMINTPLDLNYGQSTTFESERILVIPPHSKKILKTYKFLEVIKHCDLSLNKDSVTLEFTIQNSPFNFSNIFYYKVNGNEQLNEIRNDFYLSKVMQLDYRRVWVQKNKFYPCTDRPNGYYYSVSPYEASNRLYFRLRSDL